MARDAASRICGHVSLHQVGDGPDADLWTASGLGPQRLMGLNRLFVARAHRRSHVGETLMITATRYAHQHGVQPALDVAQHGSAAIALDERLGWRRVGEWELTVDAKRSLPLFAYAGPPPSGLL
ncbi:hypothetical protein Mkiyose1665_24570 [Mycobacterium kiyosense]|uniref:N-acetyltransferase domain-containing protein n=1 Tax=Mycobacterium kiyosense TaxID=2871094 RepID=A0A9P3Q2N9_9MYCO|nr:hypothetical protein IWGMT90018_48920 [Mycobacterium kiyosense]BDE15962.1 hypothetical protein MKCMC460_48220 [Mycobacterium sp. 20KCMC460]GLB81796.1 hypothetical protein SRL2020028_10520 [Mycobacterium kiyosense]GLB90340.1 hypothetical protein SRL2020130_31570 [Mycobacterium kiyosense]GLB96071.1 hypothetical protein SRL2020226_28470 [Mycobacterium kiyosense]